ncbi:hypothetical protein ACFPU1_13055 [Thalassorhabdus alkalitolerans]|uniref:Uncharacterized protein n=1 Tax=Thalassorhabdus alkalitolerans TaxID=2282697 RepID=A0ABW0YT17_9BACI|nr:hypothetical protein [Thalassobacillus sp. C254]
MEKKPFPVQHVSSVDRSGNSDVDVTVNIDTSSLAYAYACLLYAEGKLTRKQLDTMVEEMDRIYQKKEHKQKFLPSSQEYGKQKDAWWFV